MTKKFVAIITAVIMMVLMLSACGSSTSNSSNKVTGKTGKIVEVKVEAKDFAYNKKVIHVKKGETVKIVLHSNDGGHGFALPAFNVNIQGNGSAEFTASKAGTFQYYCSVMCGSGHANMKGKLIVE